MSRFILAIKLFLKDIKTNWLYWLIFTIGFVALNIWANHHLEPTIANQFLIAFGWLIYSLFMSTIKTLVFPQYLNKRTKHEQ